MPPRRTQFKEETIDQQLQQIHLLDPSSSSENLEQLGPIIKQIHASRQQEAYLRTLQGLIDSKDAEIEQICGDNYQDFIQSVSTLFDVKSYTTNLREKITTLDGSVAQVGKGLVEKKRTLLQSKKTSANLDEAIDTMQSCLRVLDVLNRIGDMVREGKYWSALRVRVCMMSGHTLNLMFFAVSRGHPEHAPHIIVPNAVFPTSAVIFAVRARSDQGRSHGVDETMASRDTQYQRPSG